jgi:hypothetical protein
VDAILGLTFEAMRGVVSEAMRDSGLGGAGAVVVTFVEDADEG